MRLFQLPSTLLKKNNYITISIMEWVILGLLILKDMTIYELNTAFKNGLSLIYSASYGNLQYAVKKLLNDEFIEFQEKIDNGRKKKIYKIKKPGRKAFFNWMHSDIKINKLETTILARVYFLGLLASGEERVGIIENMIFKVSTVENELNEMNSKFSTMEMPEDTAEIIAYQLKTLDYGIMAHSSALGWLEKILNEEKSRMQTN